MRRRGSATTAAVLIWIPALALGAGEVKPGAYCPLPEEGQPRQCLTPAQQEYKNFFEAIDDPELATERLARVERDVVAGTSSEKGYLALSSLSYGYYRLSQRVAAEPDADPVMLARLERWNALLAEAFEENEDNAPYREALREAALDIQQRAPSVRLECADERGEPSECDSTEAVIRGFNEATDRVGIRGALERVLRRIFGGADS